MKRKPITVLAVMAGVLVSAFGFVALRSPTPLVAAMAWTMALTILLIATLAAVLDPRRTFLVGFAVFGLGYAMFAPEKSFSTGDSSLLTGQALNILFDAQLAARQLPPFPTVDSDPRLNPHTFHRIGHSLAALGHGVFGGVLALFMRRKRNENPQVSSNS